MENNENKMNQSKANQTSQGSTISGSSTSGMSGQASQSGTSGKGGLSNITSNLTDKLQQFSNSTMTKVNGLSTTQKVVGGGLLALGAGWMAMNTMKKNKMNMGGSKKMNKNMNKS